MEAFQAIVALDLGPEDRLYIFGYSRGAIVARLLALFIASKKHLIAVSARGLDFERSVRAQISFLCLFDPVIGWPRFFRSRVIDHDAVLEPKIGFYLELVARDEVRLLFPSDSYFASSATTKRIETVTSTSRADTTEDRENALLELQLIKTRKSVWFPGKHADVGGHGKDKRIGSHALATALQELISIPLKLEEPIILDPSDLQTLLARCASNGDEFHVPGYVYMMWRRLVGRRLRRAPEDRKLVQHFTHPTCQEYSTTATLVEHYPLYPVYPSLATVGE